jgi:hypothetical protein
MSIGGGDIEILGRKSVDRPDIYPHKQLCRDL